MTRLKKPVFLSMLLGSLFLIVLSGCGDGGGNGNGDGTTVSFSKDIQPEFDEHCIQCHIDGPIAPAGFLPLTSEVAYENLVDQESTRTDGGGTLVIPFDSANSILYQRISGVGLSPAENTMPLGGALFSAEDQGLIKTWIDEGAMDN